MLGYIKPDKPELKIKEFELYGGYYCGICKSISKRYGQLPRMTLNYDSVFLAVLLAGMNPDLEHIEQERCFVHPFKIRSIVYDNREIDYAADMLLLLAYYKLKDDLQDEKSMKAAIGALLMKGTFKKLIANVPDKCSHVKSKLEALTQLETEGCTSLDRAAEPFAKLMEEVFDYPEFQVLTNQSEVSQLLRRIGYHIGKWIYLIDAYDDIEENIKSNAYNPLLRQFSYNSSTETVEEFKLRVRERTERNLVLYLAEIANCCGKLDFRKNKGIIENILYFGLMRKTEEILQEKSVAESDHFE
ncbi:hypothetical protein FRZ06_05955 [Anoxybacterium hadale]|uniref:Uncharacterized protein n=1 Tax=Anoxybacterium hadale TaxID=3408580 RepID=A0ACD1A913_9FIRM|nr:hypothetical protein FRZ06_05955 [Clostridiales bacterium]